MLLREFLDQNNLSISEMAEELGVSKAYLNLLVAGDRRPSALLSAKIVSYTCGAVTLDDLLSYCVPSNCPCCGKRIGQTARRGVFDRAKALSVTI